MTQLTDTYKIERTCSDCGHNDEIVISKRDAAFELVNINKVLGDVCKVCSSTSFSTIFQRPNIDFELLKEWATNLELHLMPQDEELLLADEMYVDMILQILDTISIPEHKNNLLMDALCVIVYDNSFENSQPNEQLKSQVILELNKRQDKLKLADNLIMDYIKQVVYPQLDFDRQNAT
jgi:hypothetical protein